MKQLIIISFIVSSYASFAQTGEIRGQITEEGTKKVLPFCKVMVFEKDSFITQGFGDMEGYYKILNLKPAVYNVSVQEKHYKKKMVKGIIVSEDHISTADIPLKKK